MESLNNNFFHGPIGHQKHNLKGFKIFCKGLQDFIEMFIKTNVALNGDFIRIFMKGLAGRSPRLIDFIIKFLSRTNRRSNVNF